MTSADLRACVPVNDPQRALEFCRALDAFLSERGSKTSLREDSSPEVSVVIPVFNEEENVVLVYERLLKVLTPLELSFEVLFIDDGSTDNTAHLLDQLCQRDVRVSLIQFARNFGQQTAFSAGLEYARGRAVVTMDADLQDPPEAIPDFITKWREGWEVVYGLRKKRKEGLPKRFLYAAFYRLLGLVADINIPLDAGDFCIMDRKVVDQIVSMPERNRFIRGIRSWIGFKQVGIPIERHARESGRPKYTWDRLISLALDGLIAFSIKPLRIITLFGFVVSVGALLLGAWYVFLRLTVGLSPAGFASTVVLLTFFSGVQLITIGIIGEYVGRIFEEAKRRPLYIVRRVVRHHAHTND